MESELFITNIDGSIKWLTFAEVSNLKKDILLYYNENSDAGPNPFFGNEEFDKDYWKFINIQWTYGGNSTDKYLIESGCLTILNGILNDLIEEPLEKIPSGWSWNNLRIEEIEKFLGIYNPSSELLITGKNIIERNIRFILSLNELKLNPEGMIIDNPLPQSCVWFQKNIIHEYFMSKSQNIA